MHIAQKQKMTIYHLFDMCIYFSDSLAVFVVDDGDVDELKRVFVFTPNIERERYREQGRDIFVINFCNHHFLWFHLMLN
jgi:hypothetical protein